MDNFSPTEGRVRELACRRTHEGRSREQRGTQADGVRDARSHGDRTKKANHAISDFQHQRLLM